MSLLYSPLISFFATSFLPISNYFPSLTSALNCSLYFVYLLFVFDFLPSFLPSCFFLLPSFFLRSFSWPGKQSPRPSYHIKAIWTARLKSRVQPALNHQRPGYALEWL